MPWNPKRELVQHSAELAKEKHPDGFNKAQLIQASKEVFGGFAANPFKPIETLEDVAHKGNVMAKIDGGYPVGMSGCYVVGLNGGCGVTCPVFRAGDCELPDEFTREDVIYELAEEADEVFKLYACFEQPELLEVK